MTMHHVFVPALTLMMYASTETRHGRISRVRPYDSDTTVAPDPSTQGHPRADLLQRLPWTRPMPFLRHESSTAFTTIPRTNAGIFFTRRSNAGNGRVNVA
jgi:hypothetical protein